MLYTVKSKSLREDLAMVLKARKFSPVLKGDNEIEVEVSEAQKEEYCLILAFVIGFRAFQKYIRDELNRRKVEKEVADRFFPQACQYFQNSKYWMGLTKVWITDFLQNRTVINADTFPLFNMKGFKKEIKDYVETMLYHEEADQDAQEEQGEIKTVQIQDLFTVMKERVAESDLNVSNFKELHVHGNGDTFQVKDLEGNVLDKEFLVSRIGMMIEIGLPEEDESQVLKDVMTLMCLCHVFEPEKIILHQEMTKTVEQVLKKNEDLITKHLTKTIAFVSCEGCESCDRNEE